MPLRTLDGGSWTHAPRLPLGDPYYGTCLARSKELFDPPEAVQRDLCNCGYARGRCDHFTDDAAADAVRFSVTGDESGIVRLVYSNENDDAAIDDGVRDYAAADERVVISLVSILEKGH